MSRKLFLTPFQHGALHQTDKTVNDIILADNDIQFDVLHIVLSSIAMAGVDSIYSLLEITGSDTKLIKNINSTDSIEKWVNNSIKVKSLFENYKKPNFKKEYIEQINYLSYFITDILFAIEMNSGLLIATDLKKFIKYELLPLELGMPTKVLFETIQIKNALLPVVNYEIEKKDILRLYEVFESKEFNNYKEAHLEIDQKLNLTDRTIRSIEKAGKDLYFKNTTLFKLKQNIINAIPFSAKIIDLFFGKLPGVLAEYASDILVANSKANKTIPLYSYEPILEQIINRSLDLYLEKKVPNLNNFTND